MPGGRQLAILIPIALLAPLAGDRARSAEGAGPGPTEAGAWVRRRIPGPNAGTQQTACVVFDIDGDGLEDFVVAERTKTPSVVWYRYEGGDWRRRVVDDGPLQPEAGGVACDIDGDRDPDLILGQDASGGAIWWWENPRPRFEKPWVRRLIKDGGPPKHHDQTVGDFDGDGRLEFASWNQGGRRLLFFEIPADPKGARSWPFAAIHSWSSGQELEGFPSRPVDVDLDGIVDLVGGGRWFERKPDGSFAAHLIDDAMRFTQCAAGQLVEGGRPEIVFSPGDMDGDAKWYDWDGKAWVPHTLRRVTHGHTCEIRDADGDGKLDILIGEMGNPGAGDAARTWIWYGDGKGNFEEVCISRGQGIHEGLFGDLDGDGDLDVLMKPYNHNAPGVFILLNPGARRPRGTSPR